MDEWSIDIINAYCKEHFNGRFECEVTEKKGRIMVAKCSVTQGDLLFVEPPLHVVSEEHDNEAFLTIQRLCKEDDSEVFDYEPLWYWTAVCSLTEDQLRTEPKVGSLAAVSREQQRQLLCLYHERVTEASEAVQRIVDQLGLDVDPVAVEELLQTWILNCFEHSEDPLGYSAYFASSFVSHSCGANAVWAEGEGDVHVLRARRDILPGDEVTISYLPEHTLLHSADARKHSLQETKLFVCTCERCAPKADGSGNFDPCRGFRCPSCQGCGVFHRLVRERGKGLEGVACTICGEEVSVADSRRLLKAESNLDAQLKKLDSGSLKVTKEEQALSLLRAIGDTDEGVVGPQHWLCDRLWEHLARWYKATGRGAEARHMLDLRIAYQRKAYPDLSGTLAWTLESQAGLFLEHLGFESRTKSAAQALDAAKKDELASQVIPIFEESMRILRLMFGNEHEHFTSVVEKRDKALAFLAARENGSGPRGASELKGKAAVKKPAVRG